MNPARIKTHVASAFDFICAAKSFPLAVFRQKPNARMIVLSSISPDW
jgi:hypothetical protein